ncbi:dTDP-4-dehydrorhamnose 3,5-epimerase [Ottowia sp. GY511]|uniref:dTDP-4-dehydrorhamnose 3,5-epimerase n=1 Tax=Ottowia flava TaxID=2675430 RepID=A0ABW4KSK5_9BURK|nr:dTDP-4-dehydrorhamnose 3,5-epimerase [Ottowia sp. GY511]TXK32981.1 dTDP-4-dehydrorhamnose 3,5-epimerase [Ottowia sp. GY511]
MNLTPLAIADVMLIEPKVFGDARGFFFESFNQQAFADATGVHLPFVQDNHSRSRRGVLRGLHYQLAPKAQGKLVRCVRGAVFDVAVDIRRDSPTFGRWSGAVLSEENQHQLWIPPGLAHGFVVLTDTADFLYKTTDYYSPAHERAIRWDDPAIGIEWPLASHGIAEPVLSDKDKTSARLLAEADI